MNNTVKNIKNTQDKLMNDAIASKLAVENYKKFSECLFKKQVEESVRGVMLSKK